jgi:uncharacterized protein YkwD
MVIVAVGVFIPLLTLRAATTFTGCGGEYVPVQDPVKEAQVVELVNIERAKVSLPPYKAIDQLAEAARYHSADLMQDNYEGHYTKDRDANNQLVIVCTWTQRVRKYYPDFDTLTENVGIGTTSPQAIMDAWMASSGHKAAILGSYREIGVGYYNKYWTQDFTTRNGVSLLIINREARQTTTKDVSLYIYGGWTEMRLRNDDGAWNNWQPFSNDVAWALNNTAGLRLVEMEARSGQTTVTISDTIELVLGGVTATPTATRTPTTTRTPTRTPTAGNTATPTGTPIVTSTATVMPTVMPTPTTVADVTTTPTATATTLPDEATSTATPTATLESSTPTPTPIITLVDPILGGNLSYSDPAANQFAFTIPGGAVDEATEFMLQPGREPLVPNNFMFASQSFTLEALANGVVLDDFVFQQPVTVRIDYTEANINGVDESSLLLNYFNEATGVWVDAATTCTPSSIYTRNLAENYFTVNICHLTEFAVFGRQLPKLYLPLVRR